MNWALIFFCPYYFMRNLNWPRLNQFCSFRYLFFFCIFRARCNSSIDRRHSWGWCFYVRARKVVITGERKIGWCRNQFPEQRASFIYIDEEHPNDRIFLEHKSLFSGISKILWTTLHWYGRLEICFRPIQNEHEK